MARLKLPGRSLEALGNQGHRGMIITGATRHRTRLTACSAALFGPLGYEPVDLFFSTPAMGYFFVGVDLRVRPIERTPKCAPTD